MEEEYTIQPMEEELNTPEEHPLICVHLTFREIGITPPPIDRVMDVLIVTFDQL